MHISFNGKLLLAIAGILLLASALPLIFEGDRPPAVISVSPAEPAGLRPTPPPAPTKPPAPAARATVTEPPAREARLEPAPEIEKAELRRIVLDEQDLYEAHRAAWELAHRLSLDDEDCQALARRLEKTGLAPEEAGLARTLIWALSIRPDRIPVERTAAFALYHPDDRVRRTALRTLGAVGDPWAQATLERLAIRDRSPAVRREAITYLALRLPPDALATMARKALVEETDPALQAAWNRALAFNRTPAALPQPTRQRTKVKGASL